MDVVHLTFPPHIISVKVKFLACYIRGQEEEGGGGGEGRNIIFYVEEMSIRLYVMN